MARRRNNRQRRGDTIHSICPGCEKLINENMRINKRMGKLETDKFYVVFCAEDLRCYLAAVEMLDTPEKKFKYRRRELDE